MKFYSFQAIKDSADCVEIARAIGLDVKDNRCAAVWRNGKNETSVSLNRDGFHDFSTEESGSVIDLVALVRFGGDRQQAQEYIGDYLRLDPVIDKLAPSPGVHNRYQALIEAGYEETVVYVYTDENWNPLHHTVRLEHPEKHKEFLQRAAVSGKWSLDGIRTVLYNLPKIIASSWVIIVEGEKDADTLISLGLPATTNAMGASKWKPEYSESLRGKDVVILPDNDEPGRRHADLIAGQLTSIASSVRILTISRLQKGDVTDWIEREGGTRDALMEAIAAAKPIDSRTIDEAFQIARAKEANQRPFRNYSNEVDESNAKKKIVQVPIHINDMMQECYTRFLGFPRRVGGELFDKDKDTDEIVYIHTTQQLFGWIESKSKHKVEWARGIGMTSQDCFFEGLKMFSPKYEAISSVPDWPKREKVYYHHPELTNPSPGHRVFHDLAKFFNPLTPEYGVLLKAFIAAPIYFEPHISRPMWIIDSESPGAGKSSLATRVALLYGHPAVEIKTRDFGRDMQEVTKRLVSPEGRQARVLLIDNIMGTFRSEELSAMVTIPHITGRPPYGRGEETRLNNLTYVITSNSASVDNDLSIRSFFVRLQALEDYNETWSRDLSEYIYRNRHQILSDIVDLLNNPPHIPIRPFTRFPEFETLILRAMCADESEYLRVIETLVSARSEANIDEEWGKTIEDVISAKLSELNISKAESAFIRTQVAEEWIRKALPNEHHPLQLARTLSKSGHCKNINPDIQRYPRSDNLRRRGVMWIGSSGDQNPSKIITRTNEKIEVLYCNE